MPRKPATPAPTRRVRIEIDANLYEQLRSKCAPIMGEMLDSEELSPRERKALGQVVDKLAAKFIASAVTDWLAARK